MKELRRNMRMLAALLLSLFLLFGAYFCYSVYFFGGRWFANSYNTRIMSQKQLVRAGTVTDREGTVLAHTDSEGVRHYASNRDMRRAVSHVIGDNEGKVSKGVETFHAQYLLGFKSNVLERMVQALQGGERHGDDIQLTLSAKLNSYVSANFPRGKAGAVVILNYRTGDVYAMVSKPDFDPNNISAAMEDEAAGALINRATQGLYPPGSTFKIVTMASALQTIPGVQDRTFLCTGVLPVEYTVVTDAGNNEHGTQTMKQAFANSCNTAFAALTLELGYDQLAQTATAFGVGDNFLFRDLVVENSSYPTDRRSNDDLAWSGIGQGRVLMTPLHMALVAGCVANDGVMMEPRLLSRVVGPQGQRRMLAGAKEYRRAITPEVALVLQQDMRAAVTNGTASRARISGLRVAGKTGSAEASDNKEILPHAWYVGYIENAEHPLAIAIVVENGGSGGQVAAPLAARFLTQAVSLGL